MARDPKRGPCLGEALKDRLQAERVSMAKLMQRALQEGPTARIISQAEQRLHPLLAEVARALGIAVSARAIGGARLLCRSSARERGSASVEDAKARYRAAMRDYQSLAERACRAQRLTPKRARMLGQLVVLGLDQQGRMASVMSPFWGALPPDVFVRRRLAYLASRNGPAGLQLDDLQRRTGTMNGPRSAVALWEEAEVGLQGVCSSRVLEVVEHRGAKLVAAGRFRGVALDSLVHHLSARRARLSYVVSPASGRIETIEGPVREPWVCGASEGRLMVQIPSGPGPFTETRRAMRAVTRRVPTVQYERGTRNARFYFEAKDFLVVRQALQGMALSQVAADTIRGYFQALQEADLAIAKQDRATLGLDALGGFKRALRVDGQERPLALNPAQLAALGWLRARGYRGVVALDTGLGKTLLALAVMRKMLRDGVGPKRFLYVVPASLRGGLSMEAARFLQPGAAESLLARVEVRSYRELLRTELEPLHYAACFFDEAQALKNPRSKTARKVLSLEHPKKILLTASPMEKCPMEAFVLHCAAENVPLHDRAAGRVARRKMRMFKARYLETIAGRTVGVSADPIAQEELRAWIKLHIFYAEKCSAGAAPLAPLEQRTELIEMSPALERAYRRAARGLTETLSAMIAMYRDRAKHPASRSVAKAMGLGLAQRIQRLNTLANTPRALVAGAGFPKIDRAEAVLKRRLLETDGSARAVLFSDDRALLLETARRLSAAVPGKLHAVGLSDRVELFKNGAPLERYRERSLPFRRRTYLHEGKRIEEKAWRSFVVGQLLQGDTQVTSMSLLGPSFQTGYNLQSFDTVIHMDRDSWCAEDMRQRTARVWRQGQANEVREYTLDLVYRGRRSDLDGTLDEVRRFHQETEAALFDQTVRAAHKSALGEGWSGMEHIDLRASQLELATMEIVLCPLAYRVRPPGEEKE